MLQKEAMQTNIKMLQVRNVNPRATWKWLAFETVIKNDEK
jgi:hypothetical protein